MVIVPVMVLFDADRAEKLSLLLFAVFGLIMILPAIAVVSTAEPPILVLAKKTDAKGTGSPKCDPVTFPLTAYLLCPKVCSVADQIKKIIVPFRTKAYFVH